MWWFEDKISLIGLKRKQVNPITLCFFHVKVWPTETTWSTSSRPVSSPSPTRTPRSGNRWLNSGQTLPSTGKTFLPYHNQPWPSVYLSVHEQLFLGKPKVVSTWMFSKSNGNELLKEIRNISLLDRVDD